MRIILLSGKQGAGKSTLQQAIIKEWHHEKYRGEGHRAYAVNFADIIYEMHDSVLGILHNYWPKRDIAKDGPLLQLLGTEWGRRTIDENIWVKCLRRKIEKQHELNKFKSPLFVVGDCRFPNEFDEFPDALRVRVHAPEIVRKARCSMWRNNSEHESETALDQYMLDGKFDFIVDSATQNVEQSVEAIFAMFKAKELTK
jgi:predicted AAA+ superfamily ATPase